MNAPNICICYNCCLGLLVLDWVVEKKTEDELDQYFLKSSSVFSVITDFL